MGVWEILDQSTEDELVVPTDQSVVCFVLAPPVRI